MAFRPLVIVLGLSCFWIGWHAYVARLFANNRTENMPRFLLNIAVLLVPLSWPQIAGACGYLWPFVLAMQAHLKDRVMRTWLWAVPVWLGLMLWYGLFLEIRIFGELIPYFACAAALIFEDVIAIRLRPFLLLPVVAHGD